MGKLQQLFGDMWCRDSKKGENLYWTCATIRWYRLCRHVQWNTKLYWKWMSWYVSQVWTIYYLLISTSLWIFNSNNLGFLGEWMIFRSKLYLSQTYRSNISLDNILNVKNNFYLCLQGGMYNKCHNARMNVAWLLSGDVQFTNTFLYFISIFFHKRSSTPLFVESELTGLIFSNKIRYFCACLNFKKFLQFVKAISCCM